MPTVSHPWHMNEWCVWCVSIRIQFEFEYCLLGTHSIAVAISFIYFLALRLLLAISDRWPKKPQSWLNALRESHCEFASLSFCHSLAHNIQYNTITNILQVSRYPLCFISATVVCLALLVSLSVLLLFYYSVLKGIHNVVVVVVAVTIFTGFF